MDYFVVMVVARPPSPSSSSAAVLACSPDLVGVDRDFPKIANGYAVDPEKQQLRDGENVREINMEKPTTTSRRWRR
ncbi:hypothetical protein TIFTF001_023802 [Ficus carica]|uniref:Uncharacterized protein n=1 Tax=Ficus carica TaxID=3494 RepID=A0AA88AFG6_FICCA|nr:hypothetical protein TIFTF001_023802 [Ficus carica]